MSAEFWSMVAVVAPVFIVQVFQYLTMLRNAKKAEQDREALAHELRTNTSITRANKITKDDMEAHGAGRERLGFIEGQRRATGSMPLGK